MFSVAEGIASLYGASLDHYIKNKKKYKMCIVYEDLTKDPKVIILPT